MEISGNRILFERLERSGWNMGMSWWITDKGGPIPLWVVAFPRQVRLCKKGTWGWACKWASQQCSSWLLPLYFSAVTWISWFEVISSGIPSSLTFRFWPWVPCLDLSHGTNLAWKQKQMLPFHRLVLVRVFYPSKRKEPRTLSVYVDRALVRQHFKKGKNSVLLSPKRTPCKTLNMSFCMWRLLVRVGVLMYVWRVELDSGNLLWFSVLFLRQGFSLILRLGTCVIISVSPPMHSDASSSVVEVMIFQLIIALVLPCSGPLTLLYLLPTSFLGPWVFFHEASPPCHVAPVLLFLFPNVVHVVLLLLL